MSTQDTSWIDRNELPATVVAVDQFRFLEPLFLSTKVCLHNSMKISKQKAMMRRHCSTHWKAIFRGREDLNTTFQIIVQVRFCQWEDEISAYCANKEHANCITWGLVTNNIHKMQITRVPWNPSNVLGNPNCFHKRVEDSTSCFEKWTA